MKFSLAKPNCFQLVKVLQSFYLLEVTYCYLLLLICFLYSVRVGLSQSLTVEPELPLPGRNATLTCNAARSIEYEKLYIQGVGRGICGQYILESNQDKCEKPTSTCGVDQDILVICGKSGTATPYIRVIKRNLDQYDNGLWECFGTGSVPFTKSLRIYVGMYKYNI